MPQYIIVLTHDGIQHPNPNTIHCRYSELSLPEIKNLEIRKLFPEGIPKCSTCRGDLTKIVGIELVKLMERRQRAPRWRASGD